MTGVDEVTRHLPPDLNPKLREALSEALGDPPALNPKIFDQTPHLSVALFTTHDRAGDVGRLQHWALCCAAQFALVQNCSVVTCALAHKPGSGKAVF